MTLLHDWLLLLSGLGFRVPQPPLQKQALTHTPAATSASKEELRDVSHVWSHISRLIPICTKGRNKPFIGMSLEGQYYKTSGNKNFTVPQNGMYHVFIK